MILLEWSSCCKSCSRMASAQFWTPTGIYASFPQTGVEPMYLGPIHLKRYCSQSQHMQMATTHMKAQSLLLSVNITEYQFMFQMILSQVHWKCSGCCCVISGDLARDIHTWRPASKWYQWFSGKISGATFALLWSSVWKRCILPLLLSQYIDFWQASVQYGYPESSSLTWECFNDQWCKYWNTTNASCLIRFSNFLRWWSTACKPTIWPFFSNCSNWTKGVCMNSHVLKPVCMVCITLNIITVCVIGKIAGIDSTLGWVLSDVT